MRLSEERYISLLTDFGFKQELREYEDSLKAYRDIKNSIDTAKGRRQSRRHCQRKVGHRKTSSRHGAHTRASCQRYRPFNRRYRETCLNNRTFACGSRTG